MARSSNALNARSPTAQYWANLIAEHEQSKLSVQDFANKKGIHSVTFYAWRRRLQSEKPAFVEVRVAPLRPEAPRPEAPLRLNFRDGTVSLEVPMGTDLRWLRAVVETLA